MVAERLQLLSFPKSKVITIAGTNGKGSTACFLESMLTAAGYRVGLYTSPHIHDFCERIRVQKHMIESKSFTQALDAVGQAKGQTQLTFFEWTTLAALWHFKQQDLDFILLEVGLGGRLDATNVVASDMSVITSIGLDHTEYLGTTREEIAYEKAGIMRPHTSCICGEPDVPHSVFESAERMNTTLRLVGRDFFLEPVSSSYSFRGRKLSHLLLPEIQLPLPNAVTALAVMDELDLDIEPSVVADGLQHAYLPGRFEFIQQKPCIVLDVAHNMQAAHYLKEKCASLKVSGKRYAVFGMMGDKDISSILASLKGCFDTWYLIDLPQPRAAKMEQYVEYMDTPCFVFSHMAQLWQHLKQEVQDDDCIVVFGSFYTIAEFKEIFSR